MTEAVIWVVDDDQSIRWVLDKALGGAGRQVACLASAEAARARLAQETPDVVLTDLRMPGEGGLSLLEALSQAVPGVPVIVMTAFSDLDTSVRAYDRGAFDYLPKPFDVDEVIEAVDRALEKGGNGGQPRVDETAAMIGNSAPMQQLFRVIGRLSRTRFNVLITGETGTGKELVARALHQHSPLSAGPFVALNTAAIPSELLESELFGHEKGAFTGAQRRHIGRFEQADGGSLFLDEIGDMPASLQTRLLRVLAEGEFYRVGGHELRRVSVRIIAATHQDLAAQVRAGRFREDLFHRLNVVHISVPPLRERGQDVLLLVDHFLGQAAEESGLERKSLAADARALLLSHHWPGNVRELENLCRRLTVLSPGPSIRATDLRLALAPAQGGDDKAAPAMDWSGAAARWADEALAAGRKDLMKLAVERLQAAIFGVALSRADGGKAAAAQALGIGRNTLTRRLKALRRAGYKL